MPATRLVNINGSAGAFVDILSTIPSRRVDMREDESVTNQGLAYKKYDDSFITIYTVGTPGPPDQAQVTLGTPFAFGPDTGGIKGWPAQSSGGSTRAADRYLSVRSKSVTATVVKISEYE